MEHHTKKQLFILHGWGFGSEVMNELSSCLERDCMVTALSIPGYGAKAVETKTPGLEATVAELVPQITRGSILCGWSLGGILAIKIAARLHSRISALVLIASTPCFVKKEDWQSGVEKKLIENMKRRITNGETEKVLKEFSLLVARGDKHTKKINHYLGKLLAKKIPDNDVLINGLEILAETDVRDEFQQLACPLILFLAAGDELVARSSGAEIKKINPAIHLEYLDDKGHAPFLSDPAGFGELLMNRLQEVLHVPAR